MTGSEPYSADNLLDRFSRDSTLAVHYRQMMDRERALIARRAAARGAVVSIGAGWHPGRHLFPSPQWHLVAVDADPEKVAGVIATGRADEARWATPGSWTTCPTARFRRCCTGWCYITSRSTAR